MLCAISVLSVNASEIRSAIEENITENTIVKDVPFRKNHKIKYSNDFPKKDGIRVSSWNVVVSFYDGKDKNHSWDKRKNLVFKTLDKSDSDVIMLQELSPGQVREIANYYYKKGYSSRVFASCPAEIKPGISDNSEIKNYFKINEKGVEESKFVGTALYMILVKDDAFSIEDSFMFWYKENEPFTAPNSYGGKNKDGSYQDVGFGNTRTPRSVGSLLLKDKNGHYIVVSNSHAPISGGSKTRSKCFELENKILSKYKKSKTKEIGKEVYVVSAGDRNLLDDDIEKNLVAYKNLIGKEFNDVVNSAKTFYGYKGSFIGFSYDRYKRDIVNGEITNPKRLDVMMVSKNINTKNSGHFLPVMDEGKFKIFPNFGKVKFDRSELSSDHLGVFADLKFKK